MEAQGSLKGEDQEGAGLLEERVQELLHENQELRKQVSELPRLGKKLMELRSQKQFVENELTQAKHSLITHIAALNALQHAKSPSPREGNSPSMYSQGSSRVELEKLEQENMQMI